MKASKIRNLLKDAIHLFMQHSPDATTTGTQIITQCLKELQWNTVGGQVLGDIVSTLTDSVYYSSDHYLQEALSLLEGTSLLPIRVYFSFDSYGTDMTSEEKKLFDLLSSLSTELADIYQAGSLSTIEYVRTQQSHVREAVHTLRFSASLADTVTSRFILLHIASALLAVDVGKFPTLHRYPPHPPYYPHYEQTAKPDLFREVLWATNALQALRGQGWLTLSWYMRKDSFGLFVN